MKDFVVKTSNYGEISFVEWLHKQAQFSKIDVQNSIDLLLKSAVAPQDPNMIKEFEAYRIKYAKAIQVASNKVSSEAIKELSELDLIDNGCLVTGEGRPDLDNNLWRHFVGNTFATTDLGNADVDDSRTTMTNYSSLGQCTDQPKFKLKEGEKIVMTKGGSMYIVNSIRGQIIQKILLPSAKAQELVK